MAHRGNGGEEIIPPPPLRILAAEDNPINQLVLRTLLNQVGLDPVIVDNGEACVEAWSCGAFDLILMDVQMPLMDGPTAAAAIRLREIGQGRSRTPIIAVTANAMADQLADYEAAGMDGVVVKPIEIGQLFQVINDAMEASATDAVARTA